MKYTILMGSPRKNGNTAALLRPFLEENEALGVEQEVIWLYDKKIAPCRGCKVCQDVYPALGCVQEDDMEEIYRKVLDSDLVVLATPIYSWFCTPPMKAAIDRLIYGGCKYYGKEKRPSTLAGKKLMTFATCGYPVEKGCDLWGAALLRWCKHTGVTYLGMYSGRDLGEGTEFMNPAIEVDVRRYAKSLYTELNREEKR